MSNPSNRQMNVPVPTRHEEEIQTDVNLIDRNVGYGSNEGALMLGSAIFDYASYGRLSCFSDEYLLSQLEKIVKQLKQNANTWGQSKSSMLLNQLSSQIHGLLCRELKLSGSKSEYYELINQGQKQIKRLQLKYGHYESQVNKYELRISDLQRQIENLRGAIKIYQGVQEQNQMYKQFFADLQNVISSSNKKVQDLQNLLKNQINPKINEFQVNLNNLSKSTARDRNKVKGLISKYSLQLEKLAKDSDLTWEKMYESCTGLFTATEQLNVDSWVRSRIDLSHKYEQLEARHTAFMSLTKRTFEQFKGTDKRSKNFKDLQSLEKKLSSTEKQSYQVVVGKELLGLGVLHCHRHSNSEADLVKLQQLFFAFQCQMRKIVQKFPQLNGEMNETIIQFMNLRITEEVIDGGSLGWLKDIIVHKTDVVTVENVYKYYSETDKRLIFHLRILIKSLLEEFERISKTGVDVQLDQAILCMLREHVLEGVDIEDILAIFRPPAKNCEIDVIVNRPYFLNGTKTVGVPLKQQQTIALHNLKHVPVTLNTPTVLYGERPIELRQQVLVKQKETREIAYRELVTTDRIVNRVIQNESLVQIDNEIQVPIIESHEKPLQVIRQVFGIEQQQVQNTVEVDIHKINVQEVEKNIECPKYLTNEITKVVEVPCYIPIVQEKVSYEVIETKVPHYIYQPEIRYLDKKQIIFETKEVAVEVQKIREKRVPQIEHCDCQKPEAIEYQVQKEMIKEIEKQIIVEKCHFIKGDQVEHIVSVDVIMQKPLIKEVIVDVERIIQKIVPLHCYEEKLIVIEKEVPKVVERYEPVPIIIQKPFILTNQEIKQVRIEVPVPIYIERQVPKIINCIQERIVDRIVECPRVVEVQKIVEKIVVVPRVIQKIVIVPEIVQKCVVIECPVLQIVTIQVEKPVPIIKQQKVIVQITKEILKIERDIEICEVVNTQELVVERQQIVEVERKEEFIVEKVIQIPRDIIKEKIVERVVHTREAIPVQTIVQVPIYVPFPVPIEIEKPIFYKQPQYHIEDCRLEVEKIVYITNTKVDVRQIQCPVPVEKIQVREVEREVVKYVQVPYLQIVEKEVKVVLPPDIHQTPVESYLEMDKIIVVKDQEYVKGQKVVEYLKKPTPINIQTMKIAEYHKQVPVEMTRTQVIDCRAIDEIIKTEIVSQDRIVETKNTIYNVIQAQTVSEIPVFDKNNYKEITIEREILKVDTEQIQVHVEREKLVEGLKEIIYKAEVVPQYIEKIVEKIVMIPQIVEIEKKCYMIEEINNLIAKEIDIEVHTAEYKEKIAALKASLDVTIQQLGKSKVTNTNELKTNLQAFRQILFSVDKMPKIVEKIKQVQVIVERDRPVLVPVFNSEQETALLLIISDLIKAISKLRKEDRERVLDRQLLELFEIEFQSGDLGYGDIGSMKYDEREKGKSSYSNNYNKEMPNTSPLVHLAQKFKNYYKSYSSRGHSFGDLVSSFQQHYIRENVSVNQNKEIITYQKSIIQELQVQILDLKRQILTSNYQKDKISGDLNGMMRKLQETLPREQYQSVIIETVELVSDPQMTETIVDKYTSKYTSTVAGTQYQRGGSIAQNEALAQKERKISEIYQQLSVYESQNFQQRRKISQLERENEMLKEDLRIIKSGMPQGESRDLTDKISRQWESRVKTIEESYVSEINKLRDQYSTRRDQTSNATNEIISENRKLEEEIRGIRRQYDNLRGAHDRCAINLESEKRKLIDEYQRRMKGSTATSNIERDLRRENDTLKKNIEASEKKFESQKQKLIDEYERKMNQSAGNQEKELRRQLETLKRTSQMNEQNWENQKQRINDDYDRKIKNLQMSHQSEIQRVKSDLERVKTSTTRRETTTHTTPEQIEEIRKLKDTVNKLESQLEKSKNQIENYQKSKLGHTAYTSGIKKGGEDFQSPDIEYHSGRYGGRSYDFRSPQTESQLSKEQQIQESQLSGRGEKESTSSKRVVRSGGVKIQRRYEETQEVRSSSSRISGASESSSIFKTSMSMREFMDIKKIEDKDNIATLVMIKVIEKIQQEAEKGMLNSYSPSNIFLSNFNPNNIDSLIVRFGAPITNKKSKTDGLYLAPEIHRGEGTTLKSVVFTLAVIWDELIHYEIYFKTNTDVENLSHEFKVRDTRLNPILKNTLFEMMSKDPSKRLQLGEAKRRLSLQRYILSEGRAVAASSRISKQ